MATIPADMRQRYDTAANWTSNDPVLKAGELGVESDTDKFKIGDGTTAWSSLGYAAEGSTVASLDDLTDVDTSTVAPSPDDVLTYDGAEWAPAAPGAGSNNAEIGMACSDESTVIDTTGTKVTFRMPYAMTVTEVRASLTTACTTGTLTVDINEAGVSILSTKLTVDATETTSTTAATAPVISDSALADDAEITVDVDNTGDDTATGLKVWLIGTRA